MNKWQKEYIGSYEKFVSDNRGLKDLNAYGACMDASRDKSELKKMETDARGEMELDIQYLKRKK